MAFKHLDFDRLSSFRLLHIRYEVELWRAMAPISLEHLRKVKAHLLNQSNCTAVRSGKKRMADAETRIRGL